MDDELKAANDIYAIASTLQQSARNRVMAWVTSRLKEDYIASFDSGTYEEEIDNDPWGDGSPWD